MRLLLLAAFLYFFIGLAFSIYYMVTTAETLQDYVYYTATIIVATLSSLIFATLYVADRRDYK